MNRTEKTNYSIMKIYISGKITGLPVAEARQMFKEAEDFLKKLGHTVYNPMHMQQDPTRSWESYMIECLEELPKCDCIWMLENWPTSRGARLEHAEAMRKGIDIYYQAELKTEMNFITKTVKL